MAGRPVPGVAASLAGKIRNKAVQMQQRAGRPEPAGQNQLAEEVQRQLGKLWRARPIEQKETNQSRLRFRSLTCE